MSDTLLTITQKIVRRLPLSVVPTVVIGSNDPQTQQLLAIIQDTGDDLMALHEWNVLITDKSWAIVSSSQSEPFPDDWKNWLDTASVWVSSSLLIPLSGPVLNADVWHRLVTMPGTWFPGYWRYTNQEILTLGLNTGVTAFTQYISKNWILSSDGVTRLPEFVSDDDTVLLPEVLLRLGTIWRWKQSKGLDYAEDMRNYELAKERDIAADRRPSPINMRRIIHPDAPPYAWPGMIVP